MRRLVIVLGLLGWQGYQKYQARIPELDAQPRSATADVPQDSPTPLPPDTLFSGGSQFKCDGRVYCSQMTSCEEATYFLRNCPGVKMDGDHDGIACEQQWCRR